MTDLGHSSNVLGMQQTTENRPHNFNIVAEVRAPPGLRLFAFVPCEAETRSVESCGSAVISNLLQGIETQATYDAGSQQFVVNTPNHEASKFWIGGAGQHGKVCTVFAQLTVDGKWQGPHVFVVRIRDDAGGCIYPCLSWSRRSTPWWLETPDTSHGWMSRGFCGMNGTKGYGPCFAFLVLPKQLHSPRHGPANTNSEVVGRDAQASSCRACGFWTTARRLASTALTTVINRHLVFLLCFPTMQKC